MKKVLIFNGSPRKSGNTSALINEFINGCKTNNAYIELFNTHELNIDYCRGCLRCNVLGKCSNQNDEWQVIADKMFNFDVIVFASPVYFHHVTASMKKLIDRFRSFINVQITEDGLIHTPYKTWNAEIVLVLVMGSPDKAEADPVIDMFRFIQSFMSPGKELHVITGTRLAVSGQVLMSDEKLSQLYNKMKISQHLIQHDLTNNNYLLQQCFRSGVELTV
ncbi:MAG: hypothetical protein Kow0068_25450 [Marinilabiliales bacterium]